MAKSFANYLGQDYQKLKAACIREKKLFEDDKFPANNASLYKFKKVSDLTWKRPSEIVSNPQFIVNSIVPNDLDQGIIGDCWLISSCSALSTEPELLNIVVPSDQTFAQPDYAGIFHFRFWRFGEWIDVVVDDRLPVNSSDQLVYCHNNEDPNEMWGPLIEKAYAKLNTCYEFLVGGEVINAIIDMTGGVHESYCLSKSKNNNDDILKPDQLWDLVFKSLFMKSLCGASIVNCDLPPETVLSHGLVSMHAYTVIDVVELLSLNNNNVFDKIRQGIKEKSQKNSIKLFRIRNPWGKKESWKGDFGLDSSKWNSVSDAIKNQINARNQSDGQFYISLEDFYKFFTNIDLVHVNLNAFQNTSDTAYKWSLKEFKGSWIPGESSGGCGSNPKLYWTNPQFYLKLNLENQIDDQVSLIICLTQTDTIRKQVENAGQYQGSTDPLGFTLFKLKTTAQINSDTVKFKPDELERIFTTMMYESKRQTTKRVDLPPGEYVIMPSVFNDSVKNSFYLRIFIEGGLDSQNTNNPKITESKQETKPLNTENKTSISTINTTNKNNANNVNKPIQKENINTKPANIKDSQKTSNINKPNVNNLKPANNNSINNKPGNNSNLNQASDNKKIISPINNNNKAQNNLNVAPINRKINPSPNNKNDNPKSNANGLNSNKNLNKASVIPPINPKKVDNNNNNNVVIKKDEVKLNEEKKDLKETREKPTGLSIESKKDEPIIDLIEEPKHDDQKINNNNKVNDEHFENSDYQSPDINQANNKNSEYKYEELNYGNDYKYEENPMFNFDFPDFKQPEILNNLIDDTDKLLKSRACLIM